MYNPYASQGPQVPQGGNPYAGGHTQGQYPTQAQYHQGGASMPQQQQQYQQPQNNFNINSVFGSDPTTQMGLQFGQTAFNASQAYMRDNLEQFVGSNDDIKYYFKVSNSYVVKKLGLILFPYRNTTWIRQVIPGANGSAESDQFAPPLDDINAPDLYIPSMSLLTYIVAWALLEGVRGDFHPEMLGYATTRTLAFYLVDVVLAKVAFFALGIDSKGSKLWDLACYSGYKFVPVLVVILLQALTGSTLVKYTAILALTFSLGFFLMRSLRYVVLPNSGQAMRMRTQFLFLYSFLVQGAILWLLT